MANGCQGELVRRRVEDLDGVVFGAAAGAVLRSSGVGAGVWE